MTDQLRPVIVVGAARSGTKLIRDALGTALDSGVVPYDIGYVWRYGNESSPHDCLPVAAIKPRTRRFTPAFIGRYADERGVVVEKTVGNTMRVPFVAALLPGARFVHLIRDGLDVVESARREWSKPAEPSYLRAKARHFPLRLLPTYGLKFVANHTWRRRDGHAPTWGPQYPGIDADLANSGLLTVCARQWKESVQRARAGLAEVGACTVDVRFEELVRDPSATVRRIVAELDEPVDEQRVERAASTVRTGPVSNGRLRLDDGDLTLLEDEIGDLLEELAYDRPR